MAERLDNHALVCDLVRWVAEKPRPYDQVMDAWRTSCPRLTVWEDTLDAGLVEVSFDAKTSDRIVAATGKGRSFVGIDP